jgi:thymidylate synthase ThyX
MNMATQTHAHLVWDGGDEVRIPPEMGLPCDDQMVGTTGERLVEVCTRLCYASLGTDAAGERRGRSTEATLQNVMETGHHSVLEHYVRTVEIRSVPYGDMLDLVLGIVNRPGCWFRGVVPTSSDNVQTVRITMNLRAVIEWDRWTERLVEEQGFPLTSRPAALWRCLGARLTNLWAPVVPLLLKPHTDADTWATWLLRASVEFAEPETVAERWITLYLVGSRGFSHEAVRHRFAISQRSTRYCEEGESPWHWHPLIEQYLADPSVPVENARVLHGVLRDAQASARGAYVRLCETLQDWLAAKLPPDTPYRKKHARKQARGAGRGFLGNALETQMCFSAPVWGWKHIAQMRAADAADAEIRVVIADAVECLKGSRYGHHFADLHLVPASDGMGKALAGGGHK